MNDRTKMILYEVEHAPTFSQNIRQLRTYVQKQVGMLDGNPIPESLQKQFNLLAKANSVLLRLFQTLCSVPDPNVRALLMARAGIGLPWELMKLPGGGDAKAAVIAWLDEHGHELVFKEG